MEFHNFAVNKASFIRSYRWKPMFEHALRFFNLSLLLFLLSRSSCFPTILRHSFTLFAFLFNHPFYVFLLQNVIILFIFLLSFKNHHFPINTHPRLNPTAASHSPLPLPSSPHKQTLRSQLVESPLPDPAETTKAIKSTTTTRTITWNGDKVSKMGCYRRVRSENFSTRIGVGRSPELDRLNTMDRYDGELARRLCSVEKLSKEDFNRTVEDFIAKHRRMQWEEHRE